MLPEKIIYFGIAINLALSLWYVRSIIFGHTKPNLVSWSIWALAPFVGFFLQIKAGAGLASSGTFIAGFIPLLVVIISLFRKESIWKVNSFDIGCGFLAILALVFYVLTHNLTISVVFAILSDGLAAIPTIVKSWRFPETESASVYLGGIINHIFSLFIIKNWIFPIYSLPFYFIFVNIIIVFSIHRKRIFRLSTSSEIPPGTG